MALCSFFIGMPYCSAVGCKSRTHTKGNQSGIYDQGISIHRLPTEKKRKAAWLANIKRDDLPDAANIHVCSLHFDEDQREVDLQVQWGV